MINTLNISSHNIFTDTLAQHILSEEKNALPDLSHVCIFIPNAQAVMQMRLSLTKLSSQAFIGGFIGSLPQWIMQNSPTHKQKKIINRATRQLLLIDALKQHSALFKSDNHWQICDSLLELFDELSLSPHQWLNESTPVWVEKLQLAYQANKDIQLLNQEAEIIQTLYQAWQVQLDALQVDDQTSDLKNKLHAFVAENFKHKHFYILGLEQLSPLETSWCEQLSNTCHVTSITQGEAKDDDPASTLLNNIYSQTPALKQRCEQYNETDELHFLSNIKLYDAHSSEQEAHAIDLKVRMSLLAGNKNIAVVTENRKIARRLRALLERADVTIQDTAGWALATTSAATILERWLECIEQDFAYQPLVDLLKSPFFCSADSFDAHLNLVYRFEQDIVLHENIANDIQRYKSAIHHRRQRLNQKNTSTSDSLLHLLDNIESAAKPLMDLLSNKSTTHIENWLSAFINSIKNLGLYAQLTDDIAGIRVQEELEKLQQAATISNPLMSWQDFRTWLGSTLESEQFKPHSQTATVKIMNMQQAQYCQFDSLIIAGANQQSLPGSVSQHPFFNQSVRQTLLLKNWHQKKHEQHHQFKQLLLAANDILITWQAEKNGEWMQSSPWVNSLDDFSQHAFNVSLYDDNLALLLNSLSPVTDREEELLSIIKTEAQAVPIVKTELIPKEFSASRHQRLIDCPYKFFAADVLRLKPLEQITQELLKSEYGEKVHSILHAFHQQCEGLPAPFKAPITQKNKDEALHHIEALSKQIFDAQSEDSIQHRGWFKRWMDTAESYIDWQIQRQTEWNIYQLEEMSIQALNPDTNLVGRLDRIDKQAANLSIIDYKTGATAKQIEIELAENIQLTSYAALMDNVSHVLYLKLDKGETKISGSLEGDELHTLKDDILSRLESIIGSIKTSSPLPSWGDKKSCNYCDMSGLCRKQAWEVEV